MLGAAVVCWGVCGGCAQGGAAAGLVVEATTAAHGILTAKVASIDTAGRLRYASSAVPGDEYIVERGTGDERVWSVRKARRRSTGQEQTVSVMVYAFGLGGAVQMAQTTEYDDSVMTEFDPPLVVMPGKLAAGAGPIQSLRMVVHPLSDPSKVKTQGPATHQVTYEVDESVVVPAGRFAAHKVVSVLKASLGTARVENTTESWHAPGVGIVAERRTERVSVFGLVVRSNDDTWVLTGWEK